MVTVLVCSTRILEKVTGPPLRGLVHSVFAGAANLIFADGSLLSLNASIPAPGNPSLGRPAEERGLLMPNGLLLSACAGEFPFARLRAGMSVVSGAGWLSLQAIACSLDVMSCARWNPQIERPVDLDEERIRSNGRWLARYSQRENVASEWEREISKGETMLALAERLCGRGRGLTPGGDDFLAGWLAAGWLLYGPRPAFLAVGQYITGLARQRTHALSQCWLSCAASGAVARPVGELLTALTMPDQDRLERAANGVLALGATSGFDLLQGILHGIHTYFSATLLA